MTVAILATSGMEKCDLLIATAKLQLFQRQESISGIVAAAIKNVVWRCLSMKKWYGKCHTSHTASAALGTVGSRIWDSEVCIPYPARYCTLYCTIVTCTVCDAGCVIN